MKERCAHYCTCPMTLVHRLFSGKWKILILWYLSHQTLRFSDLKRKIPDITQKMLTNQLRSLEEDDLVIRKVYPVIPPRVEYSLSESGKKMLPLLEGMYQFGIGYFNTHPKVFKQKCERIEEELTDEQ
ncbi:transcriptional regulator [Sporanaerobium hydrogeniformans]|uniref:Transcriptional regulator n=2 Tax=Sporanaerobium hydrogeniformans TaxID=3072179 RepID=A0AC61DHU2_9FIRM|nr:transcriptional regulator [Sporanaerobium hydrogeniformans]